jgi:hypothetical protein
LQNHISYINVKIKVQLSLSTPWGQIGRGGLELCLFLNLALTWYPHYFGCCREEKNLLSLQGIELLILRRQSCILAPRLTGLSWLVSLDKWPINSNNN